MTFVFDDDSSDDTFKFDDDEQSQDAFKFDDKQGKGKEGVLSNAVRVASGLIKSGVAGFYGQAGNVAGLVDLGAHGLGEWAFKGITGNEMPEDVKKTARENRSLIPTSSDIENVTDFVTGGYTKARNKPEALGQEVISDVAMLMSPQGAGKKLLAKSPNFFKSFAKPFFTAIGANLAKEGAEMFGVEEGGQTAAKLGVMFSLGLIGKKSPKTLRNELYQTAEKNLPKNAKIPISVFEKEIAPLAEELSLGGSAPHKTPFITKLREIAGKVDEDGNIPIDQVLEFKKDVNSFKPSGIPSAIEAFKRNASRFNDALKETIGKYGKTNPAFYDNWVKAEEINHVLAKSTIAANSIINAAKDSPKLFGLASSLLGGAAVSFSKAAFPAIAGGALVAGKASQIIYRICKSKTLQKHYTDLVKAATKENIPVVAKQLEALNNALNKED